MHNGSPAGAATATSLRANIWGEIKTHLATHMSAQEFENWILSTEQRGFENGTLLVDVPDQVTKEYIEQEFSTQIQSTLRDLDLPIQSIIYLANGTNGSMAGSAPNAGAAPVIRDTIGMPLVSGQLNPKFRFDNFVVGSCNQFAHAAASAVAQNPSKSYNPLFIYGGVGMGKTHLMHAIGRALLDQYPSMNVVYTSSERFMNEMIQSIRASRMPQFQRHYRSADVLLVDDIQILAGKERTQEEFFHTFNELFDHQKQIVLSSDQPPNSISGLVERLRSRFEWGLMVDVQPPDLETKMAILDKKAEMEGVDLPEEVRIYIATKTKSNVRELEGALVKLIAYSSVTGAPVNLQMAQQTLKYLISSPERRITIESILKAVAEHFEMPPTQLKQKSNTRQIAYPRQIAMYLIKDLTRASLPEIGRFFGGKHHTTVLHSVQKIEKLRHTDADLNRLLHMLTETLN